MKRGLALPVENYGEYAEDTIKKRYRFMDCHQSVGFTTRYESPIGKSTTDHSHLKDSPIDCEWIIITECTDR